MDGSGQGVHVLINIPKFSLQLLEQEKILKTFPVAVGTPKTPTPVGEFKLIHKAPWGKQFGTRWMGLDVPWGTYGIHGTKRPESVGRAVSHGCIRMFNRHAEELYEQVDIGTPVKIMGKIYKQTLAQGSVGNLVLLAQEKLFQLGIYQGNLDGKFAEEMLEAVIGFQQAHNLPESGLIKDLELELLGISL